MYKTFPSFVLPPPLKTSKKASVQIDSATNGEANSVTAITLCDGAGSCEFAEVGADMTGVDGLTLYAGYSEVEQHANTGQDVQEEEHLNLSSSLQSQPVLQQVPHHYQLYRHT